MAELKRELEEAAGASTAREKAAQERAAKEREVRLARALAELPKVAWVWERNRKRSNRGPRGKGSAEKEVEPRVSTTDPEARVMKMGTVGFGRRTTCNLRRTRSRASCWTWR